MGKHKGRPDWRRVGATVVYTAPPTKAGRKRIERIKRTIVSFITGRTK